MTVRHQCTLLELSIANCSHLAIHVHLFILVISIPYHNSTIVSHHVGVVHVVGLNPMKPDLVPFEVVAVGVGVILGRVSRLIGLVWI